MAKLKDIVRFRGDRLFNGAVSIDWFWTDEVKRQSAAEAFVFHGPKYHGVTQADVGISHGHRLIDTANFTRAVARRCRGQEDQPFTLAIAGYGTGKSHLALTLATLLSDPTNSEAEQLLQNLCSADESIGNEVRTLIQETSRPFLVVALNGMQNFDLMTEFMRQVADQVRARNIDSKGIDELRPRFRQAASLIRMSSEAVVVELLEACSIKDIDTIIDALKEQDEQVYKQVHDYFALRGMPIRVLGGESIRDVVDVAVREYCGDGKPFTRLVILFDEFGRYTEFATVRSQIAGSGVLQNLFEAVQANADTVTFIGFIQFELNAYLQRVAPEFKNDILRYITRYQSANKSYLSVNLETLLANLLEKRNPDKLDGWFSKESSISASKEIAKSLHSWFPESQNHRLWYDSEQFHNIIRKGCWPLSPYSSWLLFYLTAAGKHLQERSALFLLEDIFNSVSDIEVPEDGSWTLSPVDLWSDAFQEELIASEETGQQGSITHAYSSVVARYGTRLAGDLVNLLRALVLSSKLGTQVITKEDAISSLAELSGIPVYKAEAGISELQEKYNVIEWDQNFRQFDILGDSVPRTQFLSFIRQRVASSFDEKGKAQLFASKVKEWSDLLGNLDCDFAEENQVSTREWHYESVTSTFELLETNLKFAANRWTKAVEVDHARGTIVYCYVGQSLDPDSASVLAKTLLRRVAKELGIAALPVFVVLICDEEGILGQTLAELAVLNESLTEEDRAKFGNLVGAHIEKAQKTVRTQIEDMIRRRRYIAMLSDDISAQRLSRFGTELFSRIYQKLIPFPFDGFSTARGNAADSCQQLTTDLLQSSLDYDSAIAKPAKIKNRAITVLHSSWGVFTRTGGVSKRPSYPSVRTITEKWDKALQSEGQRLCIGKALREICLPPYGANIASAGLLLGVYVAPRMEKVTVLRNGQQYAISQWLQDGIFRGKFLDLSILENDELLLIGEKSSEWEELLDEWEDSESYYDWSRCIERAYELKERVPVPPMLGYRFMHLEKQSKEAIAILQKIENQENDALVKLKQGYEQDNVSTLSWGAASLSDIRNRMVNEPPLWTDHQINEINPYIEQGRQAIIQIFPNWLSRQSPRGETPDIVGEFKHKMLRVIGGNLKKLELNDQLQELEERVAFLMRNVETTVEARQLIRDVASWLDQNADACRIIRIAEIRGLREIGSNLSSKLQGMSRRIEMPDINDVRSRLSDFLSKLKKVEADVMKRATALWRSKISSRDDIEALLSEIEIIMSAYEGIEKDLEDFRLMRQALQVLHQGYDQLQNESLTWVEFESLSAKLLEDIESKYGEEELPWPPDEIIKIFTKIVSKQRNQASLSWIRQLENELEESDTMAVGEANRLHGRASNPPPLLTESHEQRLLKAVKQIETRLESLKIDWLVEKFKELPAQTQKKFIKIAIDLSQKA